MSNLWLRIAKEEKSELTCHFWPFLETPRYFEPLSVCDTWNFGRDLIIVTTSESILPMTCCSSRNLAVYWNGYCEESVMKPTAFVLAAAREGLWFNSDGKKWFLFWFWTCCSENCAAGCMPGKSIPEEQATWVDGRVFMVEIDILLTVIGEPKAFGGCTDVTNCGRTLIASFVIVDRR